MRSGWKLRPPASHGWKPPRRCAPAIELRMASTSKPSSRRRSMRRAKRRAMHRCELQHLMPPALPLSAVVIVVVIIVVIVDPPLGATIAQTPSRWRRSRAGSPASRARRAGPGGPPHTADRRSRAPAPLRPEGARGRRVKQHVVRHLDSSAMTSCPCAGRRSTGEGGRSRPPPGSPRCWSAGSSATVASPTSTLVSPGSCQIQRWCNRGRCRSQSISNTLSPAPASCGQVGGDGVLPRRARCW